MRADRLLSLLMLLQTRGKVTARYVASELEISERTARRDLEALMMSGVPIYSQPGRGGGWQLIGGATTDLTGLSSHEATAIFLALGSQLGEDPTLRSGLLKLLSALPESFRVEAEAATDAIKVDSSGWGQIGSGKKPRFLDQLTNAVVEAKQIELSYTDRLGQISQRTAHPLGLVTKRGAWYLVANTAKGMRTFRLTRVSAVELSDRPVDKPDDFDLESEWDNIVAKVEEVRLTVHVVAAVRQDLLKPIKWVFGPHAEIVEGANNPIANVKIRSESALGFAARIAGFGNGVELLDAPTEVFTELRRIASELADHYPDG